MSVYDTDGWRDWVTAVRAAPDDDLVRLACADWLEEQGENDRAELIRLWAAGVRRGQDGYARRKFLGRQVRRELLRLFPAEVTGRWRHSVYRGCFVMDRGFVVEFDGPADAWVECGDGLMAREPVTRVRLTTWPEVSTYADYWNDAVRWPGVTFTLPERGWPMPAMSTAAGDVAAFRDAIIRQAHEAFRLPPDLLGDESLPTLRDPGPAVIIPRA